MQWLVWLAWLIKLAGGLNSLHRYTDCWISVWTRSPARSWGEHFYSFSYCLLRGVTVMFLPSIYGSLHIARDGRMWLGMKGEIEQYDGQSSILLTHTEEVDLLNWDGHIKPFCYIIFPFMGWCFHSFLFFY